MRAAEDAGVDSHRRSRASSFEPLDLTNERWLELAAAPAPPVSARRAFPAFEELMAERDRLFTRHPRDHVHRWRTWVCTRTISGGWARMLDAMPNLYMETGAILDDLGRQPRVAREFFIEYQDRVLFGKDSYQPDEYPYYWRMFETDDEYFDYYRDYHAFWKLYGLGLPDGVLRKLYYGNALKIVPVCRVPAFPTENPTSHAFVPRDRRRRIHRLASRRRTRPPRSSRARGRTA